MPTTANIIHTAKHTVNAIVLMIATDHWRVFRLAVARLSSADIAVIAGAPEPFVGMAN